MKNNLSCVKGVNMKKRKIRKTRKQKKLSKNKWIKNI